MRVIILNLNLVFNCLDMLIVLTGGALKRIHTTEAMRQYCLISYTMNYNISDILCFNYFSICIFKRIHIIPNTYDMIYNINNKKKDICVCNRNKKNYIYNKKNIFLIHFSYINRGNIARPFIVKNIPLVSWNALSQYH